MHGTVKGNMYLIWEIFTKTKAFLCIYIFQVSGLKGSRHIIILPQMWWGSFIDDLTSKGDTTVCMSGSYEGSRYYIMPHGSPVYLQGPCCRRISLIFIFSLIFFSSCKKLPTNVLSRSSETAGSLSTRTFEKLFPGSLQEIKSLLEFLQIALVRM